MELLGLLLVLFLLAALILPWVNMARISGQRRELEQFKHELSRLRQQQAEVRQFASSPVDEPEPKPPISAAAPTPQATPVRQTQGMQESRKPGSAVPLRSPLPEPFEKPGPTRKVVPPPMPAAVTVDAVKKEPDESQDWFSKVAVWVGSIALLMAGFYMIKYSIDEGLLTPAVRIWLTTGFGALLCGAGFLISIKSVQVANERIGQALSGAGVACLYFAAYAAVHLYGFLSAGHGFGAMLAVTVLAVGLSLKNGAPVAMMGLVGGFLTPWLMSTGSNDTVMLFSYLFLLFCGAQFLCIRRGWWSLLLLSLLGAYLWSVVVIVGNVSGAMDNLAGTLIFILGICLVNAVWVLQAKTDSLSASARRLLVAVRCMTWGGGLIQGLVLVLMGGFAAVDMLLFAILSVGALLLAVLREDEFIWAAWLALAAVSVGALANTEAAVWSWLLVPLGLAGLFFAVGHWRGFGSGRVLIWRSLSVVAAWVTVPILYLNREWVYGAEMDLSASIWVWISAAAAILIALAGEHLFRREGDASVAGEYATFAVVLFGFGLWTCLPDDYYAHATAILLLLSACYWKWRELGRSEAIVAVLGVAWLGWMAGYAAEAVTYFLREEMHHAPGQDGLAVLAWLLGISAATAVYRCNREQWSETAMQLAGWLWGLVSLLGFVAAYQWLDETHLPESWATVTVEGGLTALLAVAAALGSSLAGKWRAGGPASLVLAVLVAVRVLGLHLTDTGAAGEGFFFNALLLQFGVPFAVAWFLAIRSAALGDETLRRVYQMAAMALGFIWVTFLVQDYFGGSQLFDSRNSSTEIYTYSVVWLLLATLYQVIGLLRQQSAIHVGSLILLLITIAKVFLVDASELEGLFRVLSFLGLGLALIGIGYFYNRVVFNRTSEKRLLSAGGDSKTAFQVNLR